MHQILNINLKIITFPPTRTINTHELDWSLGERISQRNSAPLVQPDPVVKMLEQAKNHIDANPNIMLISEVAQIDSLNYLKAYTKALKEELERIAKLQAFLNGRNSVSSSNMNNQSPIIDEDNDVDDDYIELETDSETPVIPTTFINPTPIDMSPNAVTLAKAAAAAKMNTANSNNNVNSNNSKKNKKNQNQKPNNDQL